VEELLTKGRIGPLSGFISKLGRPFAAELKLNDEYRLEFDFGEDDRADDDTQDLSALPVVGKCPKCGGKVLMGSSYFCEHTQGTRTCDFRSGKTILQQEISVEQFQKLLDEGKTDLLENFVSNRTHRKFKAYLVLNKKTGKVGFEFQERAPAASADQAGETKTVRKTTARKTVTAKK
ncbi:MAG: topoisomerase C-terminal repeat-containing protein, partial [Sutterellaceae bacterium]|nr:topoisomerase C-terminal repeat-containing protein [Sutterellaceae bacterium]